MPFFESSRARASSRLAAIAMLSAGMAGCSSDISRFNDNPFQSAAGGNVPPSEVTGTVAPTQGVPVGRVESQPLPSAQASGALPPPPPPVYRAAPAVPASPQRTTAAPVHRPAGIHVVAPRETLISIAKLYSKPRGEIALANGIAPTAALRVGQRLTIPGIGQEKIKTAAVMPPATTAAAKSATPPVPPQARPVAQAKPQAQPAPAPSAPAPAVGQKPPVQPKSAAPQKTAEAKSEKARIAVPANDTAAEAKDGQPSSTGAVPTFRWPVRGRVIAGFGPKPSGQQNDGINLAVPEGTSAKAAEDGVVAYSGNELKGYGNLVLVRHSNGYVTAYAHASELKVKRGDAVKRGQIIALAGQTGTVSSPQLHFEIRKGSTPVDPTQFLTGN